jgi:nucleoid-associated protein YgaU
MGRDDEKKRAMEEARRRRMKPSREVPKKVPEPKYMAEHTVESDETLSHIALKYYGSAIKEKWMIIYEANKDVIGDNPNIIVPGQVLKIPEI